MVMLTTARRMPTYNYRSKAVDHHFHCIIGEEGQRALQTITIAITAVDTNLNPIICIFRASP
jgi:hypothetical protein